MPKRLANIQALRAIAAFGVLLHHALPHYQAMGGDSDWIRALSHWGFVGVDLFFLISGYIMLHTTVNKPRNFVTFRTFLRHRFARIYLGYWPFFIAMSLLLLLAYASKVSKLDWIGSFLLIQPDMHLLVLPVSWTLTYELYFYVMFSLSLWLPQRYAFFLFFLWFTLLILAPFFFPISSPSLRFFFSPLILEFFAGMLLFLLHRFLPPRRFMIVLFLLLAWIGYGYGITHDIYNGWQRLFAYGSGALGLLGAALFAESSGFFKVSNIWQSLGNASYALYLSHLIWLELFWMVGLRSFFKHIAQPELGLTLLFAGAVTFSLLYYRYVERPLYRKVTSL